MTANDNTHAKPPMSDLGRSMFAMLSAVGTAQAAMIALEKKAATAPKE